MNAANPIRLTNQINNWYLARHMLEHTVPLLLLWQMLNNPTSWKTIAD